MSDFDNGAAPAAADSVAAPAPEAEAVHLPNPIETIDPPEPAKAEAAPAKAPSIDDALDRATAKVEAEAKAKPADKPADKDAPAKPEAVRDETGKFAPKEPAEKPAEAVEAKPAAEPAPKAATPHSDAPTRFSPDAKAAWETAPEPVKAEVHRAIRELEQGHQKYRTDAEAFEPIRKFHEMAQQGGTTLDAALSQYTNMEHLLRTDTMRGLHEICQNLGLNLREVAAHIVGQSPDQVQTQQDSTISELRRELASLKEQVGGVTQTFAQQREAATVSQIEAFAADKPRFDELADDISFFLSSNKVPAHLPADKRLSEAYALAERLNPAPAQASAPPAAFVAPAPPDLTAQTLKGTKSIHGSPAPGSDPAKRKASASLDESLDRAIAKMRAAG